VVQRIGRLLGFASFALLLGCGPSEEKLSEQSRAHAAALQSKLGATLQEAIADRGPAHAIAVCRHDAPAIASELSTEGWEVGRTALKLRNPDNAPDEWERKVLESFVARIEAGEDPTKIEHHEIVERGATRTFRYMKAIPTGGLCLTCHGEKDSMPSEVRDRLAELYPEDRATGFGAGELRGAFTISRSL
jgi:hypothetical protein